MSFFVDPKNVVITGGRFARAVHDPHEGENHPPSRSPMLPPNVRLPKLIDYLQSGEAYTLVKTGISNLVNHVKIIEERFAAISRDMKALDNLDVFYDDIGKPIALHPHWAEIHDKYTNLIMDSKSSAARTKAKIDELISIVLPHINGPAGMEYLQQYIESLAMFEEEGDHLSTRFTHLRMDIDYFREALGRFTKENIRGGEVEEIDRTIQNLEERRIELASRWEHVKNGVKVACSTESHERDGDGSTVDVSSVAGSSSLFGIVPEIEFEILDATLRAIDPVEADNAQELLQERKDTLKNVIELKVMRCQATFATEEVMLVAQRIEKLKPGIQKVLDNMSAINDLSYRVIVMDCHQMSNHLSSLGSFRIEYLSLVEATYKTISWALEDYSLIVI